MRTILEIVMSTIVRFRAYYNRDGDISSESWGYIMFRLQITVELPVLCRQYMLRYAAVEMVI